MENNFNTHIEHRKRPINIIDSDEHLFQHEYEYICNEPVLKNYLNAFFNTEGYVYQNFKPVIETLSTNKSTQSNYLKNLIKCIFLNHKRINKSAFFIHDYWYEGYFHWNMDALPKLYFISQDTNLKNAKLIIPNYYLKIKYIKESLLLLGFNENNFISVDYSKVCYCKSISYCPPFTISGNYHTEITLKMAAVLKNRADTSTNKPIRLIYVTRRNAQKRKIINESEIEKILVKFGFEIIETDNLSYVEQIHLFNAAKWLISIHGAALTNMLFMNKATNVLEIRNENDASNNCYFSLASAMGLNYYYLKGKRMSEDADQVGNLYIEPAILEKLLYSYL